jgi:hypothetical protein
MNVAIGNDRIVAERVWYDALSGRLNVEMQGVAYGLGFGRIPDDEFESKAPVIGFSIGCNGAVVVCRHQDGLETWFPVDMWLPGGFTPEERDEGGKLKAENPLQR